MKVPVLMILGGLVLFLVGGWLRTDPGHDPLERSTSLVGVGALVELIALILVVVGVIAAGVKLGRR